MAETVTRNLPSQFIEDIGVDLSKQLVASTAIPTMGTGLAGISQQPGEAAADFAARQQAARSFDTRKQSLSGLAPQIAGQDAAQTQAYNLGTQGVGSYQPFLNQAQAQAQTAAGLGNMALGQLGTAGTELTGAGTTLGTARSQLTGAGTTLGTAGTELTGAGSTLGTAGTELTGAGTTLGTAGTELTGAGTALGAAQSTFGGIPTGAMTSSQIQDYMSPYQSQVMEASLKEFDRNAAIQRTGQRDSAIQAGAYGGGREGVLQSEYQLGSDRERSLLQSGMLQQGFNQAQQQRQQDIQNRFNLGQAQSGLAGQQAGFAGQRAALAGQQAGFAGQRGALAGQQAGFAGQRGALAGQEAGLAGQRGSLAGQEAGFAGQRAALAGATQGLGSFQSGLASQQAQLGAQTQSLLGADIANLGTLGSVRQSQTQAELDAITRANSQAAFLPQENLSRYAGQVAGLMGGYPGQTTSQFTPNASPMQNALTMGTGLGSIYSAIRGN